MSRRLKIIFGLSLALNVLVFGFAAGHMTFRFMHDYSPWPLSRRHEEKLLKILPPEKAAAVAPMLEKLHAQQAEMIKTMYASREDIIAILTASEFDETKMREKLAAIATMKRSFGSQMGEILITAAKDLDLETRKKLARFLRKLMLMRMMPPPPPPDEKTQASQAGAG